MYIFTSFLFLLLIPTTKADQEIKVMWQTLFYTSLRVSVGRGRGRVSITGR